MCCIAVRMTTIMMMEIASLSVVHQHHEDDDHHHHHDDGLLDAHMSSCARDTCQPDQRVSPNHLPSLIISLIMISIMFIDHADHDAVHDDYMHMMVEHLSRKMTVQGH